MIPDLDSFLTTAKTEYQFWKPYYSCLVSETEMCDFLSVLWVALRRAEASKENHHG